MSPSSFSDEFSKEVFDQTYRYKNETLDETHLRIAKTIASAERKEDQEMYEKEFMELLKDFKFVPGGRIISNAGTDIKGTSLINCFTPDTLVLTDKGYKPISDIEIGNLVLTHKGQWQPVASTMKRIYNGILDVYIPVLKGTDDAIIKCTPNHKFYNSKTDTWVQSKDNYQLSFAFSNGTFTQRVFTMDYTRKKVYQKDIIERKYVDFGNVDENGEKVFDIETMTGALAYEDDPLKNKICINTLVPSSDKVMFSMNQACAREMGSVYASGVENFTHECKDPAVNQSVRQVAYACLVENKIPKCIWHADIESKIAFLESARGTFSNQLLLDMHALFLLTNKSKGKKFGFTKTSLEMYNGDVYNIAVQGDNSYVVSGGVIVKNCFVSGAQGYDIDSMGGILDELRRQALILKSEGGYGFCADFMRPRGAFIAGIASEAPGAVKMAEMWDTQSNVITSGSGKKSTNPNTKGKIRKGAQMITMSAWHPDIEEFITAKQTPGRLTKFNMSVLVSNTFMDAVKNHKEWHLEFPDIEKHKENYKMYWTGDLKHWKAHGYSTIVYKTFEDANALWELITKSTYNRNEPGVLFVDRMNERNNLYYNEHISATNPCLTGDTLVLTTEGNIPIENLVGKQFSVVFKESPNDKGFPSTPNGFWSTGVKPVFKISLWSGASIRATANHRFMRVARTIEQNIVSVWTDVKDIRIGDKLAIDNDEINGIKCSEVVSIEPAGEEEVYDCTIPGLHYFSANGIISHNCGEQILPIGGVCLLGSINLTQFVNKKEKTYDWVKLETTIKSAVRFLDNVNDISFVPLEEQRENLKNKRRIGLGVLGYGSSLMMMKIKYGSQEALDLTERLMKNIQAGAYRASSCLAAEKGPFPLFDVEKFTNGEFFKSLEFDSSLLHAIKTKGLRNSHLLSIQPTGNTSICSNNVSGGLEPLFMSEYTRTSIFPYPPTSLRLPKNVDWDNATISDSDKYVWKWTKEGDDNVLKTVITFDGFYWKMDKQRGLLRETPVKDYAVRFLGDEWDSTAEWAATTIRGLTVKDHINVFKIFAKYVDSACSKTVGCPADFPYEDFKSMYMDAFDTGYIKGITTYREGTMSFVLSETGGSGSGSGGNKNTITFPLKRPDIIDCDISNFRGADGENYIILIGTIGEKPYEVFAFKQSKILLTDKIKKGKLVKTRSADDKRSQYNLETDYVIIEDLSSHFENDEQSALTRIISVGLRNKADINEIYHQLTSCGGTVGCFASSIARTLSKYVSKVKETMCEECSDPDGLVFQEGCLTCKNCAWSKCI
jgi:ribonucleotide reductase alpha subunit